MEVKTEADDITGSPHDDQPTTGESDFTYLQSTVNIRELIVPIHQCALFHFTK